MIPPSEMTRFLLNQLNEPEREKIQQRILLEEGFAEQVEAVERELLDAYARRELSADVATQVEKELLFNQRQRAKLVVAHSFAKSKPNANWAARFLPLAATVLAAAGVGGYLTLVHQAQKPEAHITQSPPSLPPNVVRPKTTPGGPRIAVLLTPGVTRGSKLPVVRIPSRSTRIQLDLELPPSFESKPVSVALYSSDHEQVWTAQSQTPNADGLLVEIPADVLATGTFQLVLNSEPPVTYWFIASLPAA